MNKHVSGVLEQFVSARKKTATAGGATLHSFGRAARGRAEPIGKSARLCPTGTGSGLLARENQSGSLEVRPLTERLAARGIPDEPRFLATHDCAL